MLREEIKNEESEQGKLIKSIIADGKIVPVKITCGLIKNKMESNGKDKIYLIDGYPRNKDNVDGWNEVFNQENKADILCLINLDCSEETCISRLTNRGKTSGRIDDDIEVIKKRIQTHNNESVQVLELMKNYKIITVSSETTPDKVLEKASEELTKVLGL